MHGGKFATRYFDHEGKIFCIRVTLNPWAQFWVIGALFEMAFYDLDGDGTFEGAMLAGGVPIKNWIPLAPKSMAFR